MNIDNVFPSNYLKASELDGQDKIVTISKVTVEEMGSGKSKETKPVIHFQEIEKGLACNKTNANTIKGLYGPDTDGWIGRKITLFATEVEFQGEQVEAIRVRMRSPNGGGQHGPSNGNPSAPPDDNQMRQLAMREAWAKFNRQSPGQAADAIAASWKGALSDYFPGKNKDQITTVEWKRFAADDFKPLPDPFAVPAGGGIPEDDIPFSPMFDPTFI